MKDTLELTLSKPQIAKLEKDLKTLGNEDLDTILVALVAQVAHEREVQETAEMLTKCGIKMPKDFADWQQQNIALLKVAILQCVEKL